MIRKRRPKKYIRIKEMVTNWIVKLFQGAAREAQPHPFLGESNKTQHWRLGREKVHVRIHII